MNDPLTYGPGGIRCGCGKDAHSNIVHCQPDQPATPGTMPPDLVNAIVRDMDDPRYPTRIGVFCDTCFVVESHEYMVSDEMGRSERAGVARAHMRTRGWQCDESDFCPEHAGAVS